MRKNGLLFILFLLLVLLPFSAHAQSMADYTCYPIFTATSVKPNILIMVDNSGNMNLMAFGYDAQGFYHPDDFDPATKYTGYFNPTQQYSYNIGEFDMDPAGSWDGNFLNWMTMRRVDIMRKVLVGGLATSRTGGGNTKLYGEDATAVSDHKFFKFYSASSNHTPFSDDHVFKISKGNIEVYSIDDPAAFDYGADYKMHCNPPGFGGHETFFEDFLFLYDGLPNKDGEHYSIYPRFPAEVGGCDYNKYDYILNPPINGLTYVEMFKIQVDKEQAEEPSAFDSDGNIAGVVQRINDKARFGIEFFNRDGSYTEMGGGMQDSGKIASTIGGNLTDIITAIENTECNTWTPLAEALYTGIRYYQQEPNKYYSQLFYSVNQAADPFYYADLGRFVECGNNFILIVTSGESTMDTKIPDFLKDYDGDGTDPGAYPNMGTDYLDDVALWANTTDLRPVDIDGFNNIITYTVFAFGTDSQLLKDTAKNGGFIDKNGNSIPDLVQEWDENGDGDPDTYFEASDGNRLEARLLDAITAMLQRAASGTAVSLLSTSAEGEGSLFQAFFKPRAFDNLRLIKWIGYLNSLWVDPYGNLREDTDNDNALVYDKDEIIRFTIDSGTGDTAIQRYVDTDGDGRADIVPPATEPVPYVTVPLSELKPQWEAGKKLAQRSADTRVIKTWIDPNGNGVKDPGEVIDFIPANASVLRPFLDVATDIEAEDIINFIRGEEVAGLRDRNITISGTPYVWKLGDIVYSTPTVVGKPMEMYNLYYSDITYAEFYSLWKNRGVTVYVGANDGMLHAFKAGTFNEGDNPATLDEEHGWYTATEVPPTADGLGEERWAFIPFNLLPHLKWLTDPDYTHVYYVDLKPKVTDVRIFNDDAVHPNGWGTILIGGMRLGGGPYTFTEDFDNNPGTPAEERTFRSAYYLLDITVPNNPVFLGEFTDEDMNFTTSYPAISRLEQTEGFQSPDDDEWFVLVGSGPTECDGSSNKDGHVFVYDLNTGQQVQKMGPLENNGFMAAPVTIDIDLNYNTELMYVGETHVAGGNVFGKMNRISPRSNPDPAVFAYKHNPAVDPWILTTFFRTDAPITAQATASIDEEDNVWVYFGTGKYFEDADKTDITQQYFYGIKDPCPWGGCDPVADEVLLADLYNSTNITVLTNGEVIGATATTWDEFVDEVQAEDGWYYILEADGERVLNRASVLGGVVLTAPFTPDDDVCGFGGTGALYAFYYETGTAFHEPILGKRSLGDDYESIKTVELDKGITSEIGLHVGKKVESTGFIQQGTGEVIQVEVDPALDIKSGIVGWQQY
jgi:type IV pilus assembly protein PilY1